jgi:hypothetical protein
MKKMRKHLPVSLKIILVVLVAITVAVTAIPGFYTQARADKGAAFVGGLVAGHVVSGAVHRSKVRTAAAVQTAENSQPRQTYAQPAPAPAPAAHRTPEQKIKELDKLAAGGYITPAEYKSRKKAILDSM